MNTELARFNMVEQQIRTWHVLDMRVLGLLAQLDRSLFVPSSFAALAQLGHRGGGPGGSQRAGATPAAHRLQNPQLNPSYRSYTS